MVVTTFIKDATMFGEDEIVDQEEFEHLLYNQVYHSSENTDSTDAVEIISNLTKDNSNPTKKTSMNYSPGRYFHEGTTGMNPFSFARSGFSNMNNYPGQLLNLPNSGFPLTHMLVSPINNIVVLPNPPTQVFVNKEPNRRKRWKRKKKKRCEGHNSSVAEVPRSDEKRQVEKATEKSVETIDVYDSNDSDVCYIEVKPPLVVVSSDDEEKPKSKSSVCDEKVESAVDCKLNDSADNDVIFVPTKPKEIETVTIDEEPLKSTDDTVPVYQTPEHIPTLQKEILGTPESTMSNDFLEGTSEFSQSKFNFGLHGVDFNTKELNKPPNKPAIERSETESSASDISTPIKTAVFNEIPFESPTKNIFNENNLENFADFIVPKRAQNASTPKNQTNRAGNVCQKRSAPSTSDSSSESDYEEVNVKRKAPRLPSLSVFEEKSVDSSTLKQTENVTATTTLEAPSTSSADVKMNISSDAEESKVNAVDMKKGMTSSTTKEEPLSVDDDGNRGESHDILSSDSDASNSSVFNMDNYITIDEVYEDTSNTEEGEREAIVIDSSDSEESCFNTEDLENVGDDIRIVNCERPAVEYHEPRDETLQKGTYSFDTVWTEDKEKFYKESWGQENFSVTEVQKTMSDDPNLWKILDDDKDYLSMFAHKRKSRCRKCRGNHHVSQCSKQTIPKCFLCGFPGHFEPRCPNRVCMMCGKRTSLATSCSACNKNRYQVCKLCKMAGHLETRCPDLWRRYFLTTKEGPLVRPEGSELKDSSRLCCSGCGQMGHLEHMCNYYNRSYLPVNPLICRYEDVYGEKDNTTVQQQEQDDLRKRLQNRRRKAVRDESGNVNIPNYPCKYEGDQIMITAMNDSPNVSTYDSNDGGQQFGCIFDRNKDLAAKNSYTSVKSLLDCDGTNSDKQQTGCVFDRNKDFTDTSNAVPRQKFSFLQLSQNYFAKAKKSRLLLNPCVTANLHKQATHSSKRNAKEVFNGFEPDVEKSTPPAVKVHLTESLPNKVNDMHIFLTNAMKRINACRNLNIREVWDELEKQQEIFDRKPNELTHQTIKSLFERLHVILFGIHRLLAGANAVKTLRDWKNHLFNKEDNETVLPEEVMNDISKAYDYIFGNSRRDLDYQKLINSVDRSMNWDSYAQRDIHNDYNFFLQNANGTAFKKLHALYAKVKSGKGNVTENAQHFKNTFKIFYNNVCRSRGNLMLPKSN